MYYKSNCFESCRTVEEAFEWVMLYGYGIWENNPFVIPEGENNFFRKFTKKFLVCTIFFNGFWCWTQGFLK